MTTTNTSPHASINSSSGANSSLNKKRKMQEMMTSYHGDHPPHHHIHDATASLHDNMQLSFCSLSPRTTTTTRTGGAIVNLDNKKEALLRLRMRNMLMTTSSSTCPPSSKRIRRGRGYYYFDDCSRSESRPALSGGVKKACPPSTLLARGPSCSPPPPAGLSSAPSVYPSPWRRDTKAVVKKTIKQHSPLNEEEGGAALSSSFSNDDSSHIFPIACPPAANDSTRMIRSKNHIDELDLAAEVTRMFQMSKLDIVTFGEAEQEDHQEDFPSTSSTATNQHDDESGNSHSSILVSCMTASPRSTASAIKEAPEELTMPVENLCPSIKVLAPPETKQQEDENDAVFVNFLQNLFDKEEGDKLVLLEEQ